MDGTFLFHNNPMKMGVPQLLLAKDITKTVLTLLATSGQHS